MKPATVRRKRPKAAAKPPRSGRSRQSAAAGTRRSAPAKARKPRETPEQRAARAASLLATLRELYPDANCALRHGSAYELLVATILSAQCTDERVNRVTPAFFARFPDARALASADPEDVEALIRSTGFFRNKTRSLIGMAQAVCSNHGGDVPDSMEALLELPGVARKTANCVLGTWFRKNEGVVVDTHVGRLATRLGLLANSRNAKDAVRIERELMTLFPRESWTYLSHALILHGRGVCAARRPRCEACALSDRCPSSGAAQPAYPGVRPGGS